MLQQVGIVRLATRQDQAAPTPQDCAGQACAVLEQPRSTQRSEGGPRCAEAPQAQKMGQANSTNLILRM